MGANLTLGFTGEQTLELLESFDFSSSQTQLVKTIKPWQLGMTCDELTALLDAQTFSSAKMGTLADLVDFVTDLDPNNQTIIDAFTFSSDKAKAAKLIAEAQPISCLFGDVNVRKHMVFVIDYSGSMDTKMTTPTGERVTRLRFVQQQMRSVLEKSLQSSQALNVISFSTNAQAWQPGVVPATPANRNSAVAFVENIRIGGGTNMLAAIQLAVSDPNAEGIVLLSDGEPNGGQSQMLSIVKAWRGSSTNIVNTVLLEAGGSSQSAAQKFLCDLAAAGGGVCRTNK